MRKLTLALAVGLLVAGTGMAASPRGVAASAPAYVTKVVIVVGQTQGITASYINNANTYATDFQTAAATAGRSVSITTIYSPNAPWSAVHAAAKGANILVYLGHGNGYPNPYVSYEQPLKDNGMGLNNVAGTSSSTTYYYGEAYMAQLQLAPNAIVILNHLCYASGNSESGYANPTLAVAKTRVDGYGSGFIRGGAAAVIAEGTRDIGYFINALFNGHETVDAMWKGDPTFNSHVISYASSRSAGYTSELDPNVANPPPAAVAARSTTARWSPSRPRTRMPSSVARPRRSSARAGPSTRSPRWYAWSIRGPPLSGRWADLPPVAGTRSRSRASRCRWARPSRPFRSNAIAITANLTITNQTAAGWLYLGPTVNSAPVSSTINFPKGDNRANGVTVALSPQGTVGAWYGAAGGATIDLIIDVTGYFLAGTSGDGYVAYGPQRVMDTRPNSGIPGPSGVFPAGQPRSIPIAGVAGLPANGIVAVAGNLTVVGPTAAGYVTLGPDPTNKPPTSTINFPKGDTRANNVVVPLNADGSLSAVYMTTTPGATVHLVLDISGYFVAGDGALLNTMQPVRMLDSRPTRKGITNVGLTGPFYSNTPKTLQITGTGVVPTGAVAITANLTVTGQSAAGFAALGPTINASTNFSNLNFPVGDNRANGATVPLLTPGGSIQLIYVAAGSGRTAQLILDVTGYYMPPA